MRVPNADAAMVPERKIIGYLLDRTHPKGGSKARFFLGHGYRMSDWQRLADDLRWHVQTYEVTGNRGTWGGMNYEVTGLLGFPDGTAHLITSVWYIRDGVLVPQLVTAHPTESR